MAPYDSDSSGGEEEDYTETNVLLGYAGKDAQDDIISYLGGEPVSSPYYLCKFQRRLTSHPSSAIDLESY